MRAPTTRQKKRQRARDKRKNTVAFNLKSNKRREKAKHDAINRKKNRRCGYGG